MEGSHEHAQVADLRRHTAQMPRDEKYVLSCQTIIGLCKYLKQLSLRAKSCEEQVEASAKLIIP
jgi:hypothetical protein